MYCNRARCVERRDSGAQSGDVVVGSQFWRGVVLGGIVSHPARQQSGGENERPRRGCNGGSRVVYQPRLMRRCIRCRFGSRAGDGKPGTRASCGGGLVW